MGGNDSDVKAGSGEEVLSEDSPLTAPNVLPWMTTLSVPFVRCFNLRRKNVVAIMAAIPKKTPTAIPAVAPSPSLVETAAAGDVVVRAAVDAVMSVITVVLEGGVELIVVSSILFAIFGTMSYVACTVSMVFIWGLPVEALKQSAGYVCRSYGGRR